MSRDTLSITDNRTGKSYELKIEHGTIKATDLRQIKIGADDFGLMTYDPGFMNTAACKSRITFIDGDQGILRYRGYPIEQLAEKSSFLECVYLLRQGELPDRRQLDGFSAAIRDHMGVHENARRFISGFRHDAHPMAMFLSTTTALGTFYQDEARDIFDPACRTLQFNRMVAKMPAIAACCYRHIMGMPFVYPDEDLSYPGNFLNMMFRKPDSRLRPNPVLERALDILFILHLDHEQNCSTTTMRGIGSSHCDPFTALGGAAAALYGPLHGGANEAVLRMLAEIGSKDRIPEFIKRVKSGAGRLMGFGHRVYKNYDPRAKIVKQTAGEVFAVTGRNPLLDIALELERIALDDEYFVSRKLYPNVDFYSGLIYQAMGFPAGLFPVLFAVPRTAGWLTQWEEQIQDPEQKIVRPRQVYLGADERAYVPMHQREPALAAS
jgi:citrate synthase